MHLDRFDVKLNRLETLLERLDAKLDRVLELSRRISHKEDEIMAELDDLESQVKANTDLEQSAIVLIQGIAAKLAAASQDPARVRALSNQLTSSASSLAAAIAANTN